MLTKGAQGALPQDDVLTWKRFTHYWSFETADSHNKGPVLPTFYNTSVVGMNRLFRRRSKTSRLHVTGLYGGIIRWPVDSPHKGPVTRKMFPFDDAIMNIPSPHKIANFCNTYVYSWRTSCAQQHIVTMITSLNIDVLHIIACASSLSRCLMIVLYFPPSYAYHDIHVCLHATFFKIVYTHCNKYRWKSNKRNEEYFIYFISHRSLFPHPYSPFKCPVDVSATRASATIAFNLIYWKPNLVHKGLIWPFSPGVDWFV